MTYRSCPVCGSNETTPTISRESIPILQNRVYSDREEALAAAAGRLTLCTCSKCGFSYNGEFDESLIVYDENYNNDVPSATFERYAEDVARLLIEKHNLTSGTVYDVGCGKGTFLRTLCRLAPGIKGIGIDPSCEPTTEDNFTLVRDIFRPGSFEAGTKLVVLRHVLEHITSPVDFLIELGEAAPNIPLYVEVPEVNWIFENGAFWDFCYEHCNYFSAASLKNAMALSGFSDIEQSPAFGGQYQWAIGTAKGGKKSLVSDGKTAVTAAVNYAASETASIDKVRGLLQKSCGVAVWGMATKGVILACLADGVTAGIDINARKQKRYAPFSGLLINPPEWLKDNQVETILIMNGNYEQEIKKQIADMGISANVIIL